MWTLLGGIFFGWSLGANDSANIFGTGVGTGTVRYRTAILLTALFVVIGALLEGPKCMATISDLSALGRFEAFHCTFAAAITMTVLTILAMPASASQAIVGAVLGAGILSGSADFSDLYRIVSCWVFTPLAGAIISYLLHRILGFGLQRTVTSMTRRNFIYHVGILISGCYGAYCLGANNVANVTGVYVGTGLLSQQIASLMGGLGIALGVLTYSRPVMETVGKGIVPLDPFSALVVVLSEGVTLHIFTQIGVPVSSSQAVVGAVVGVGLVGDVQTVSFKMLLKIGFGWLMTPVSGGVLACIFIGLFT
ncbi:MAG: inorganic phosphate transporter [Thermodesulfobacteriota bacterium]